MIKRFTLLVTGIIFFCFSCKKDTSVGYPSVQIITPPTLSTYAVFDTVVIKANVSDASSLQSIVVYITNAQNIPVLPTANIHITGKSMSFTCYYPLNDLHLASGEYTIVVKAYNGTNVQYGFQQIYIDAVPTVRLGIYVITRNSSGVHVSKLDTNFNASVVYTQGGDYSASDINSYFQQLYISAADSGNFTVLSMPSATTAWSMNGIVSPLPYFTNTYSYGDAVYISQYNGLIKYYNHLGTGLVSSAAATSFCPIKTAVWNNYLFAEEKNIGSSTRNLVVYYAPSGAGYEQSSLSGPVVAMFGMDVNDLFVFGNQNSGGAYLQLFNIPGNIFYSPLTMPAANLLSVTQIDPQTYLLGFDNSIIYIYTYNPNGMTPFISGVSASHLQYDATDNELVVSSGKYVYEYNYSPVTLLYAANMQDSVLNVHLLFNK
jgi:hypothetical protein